MSEITVECGKCKKPFETERDLLMIRCPHCGAIGKKTSSGVVGGDVFHAEVFMWPHDTPDALRAPHDVRELHAFRLELIDELNLAEEAGDTK